MLKLYKRIGPGELHYSEAWVDGDEVVEHWGVIGHRGRTRQHPIDPERSEEENLERILAAARHDGFAPIPIEEHAILLVEYVVQGFGTEADLEKRHRLEARLNNLTGWTGLGYCDGGSIGSDTMEACCYVVDFGVAKRVVADDLADTEFGDYSRIYDEGE